MVHTKSEVSDDEDSPGSRLRIPSIISKISDDEDSPESRLRIPSIIAGIVASSILLSYIVHGICD